MSFVDPFAVLALLDSIRTRAQDVKVYRWRCRNLMQKCQDLIDALSEVNSNAGTPPPSPVHTDTLNEARATLEIISSRVDRWANLTMMRSFLLQGDIREGLEEMHRKIDTCISTYQVRTSRQIAQAQQEQYEAARKDTIELRERLDELSSALIQYFSDRNQLQFSPTFQQVVEDIQEENPEIDAVSSTYSYISGGSQSDPFDRAIRNFCKSLVTLELSRPIDPIAQARSPRRTPPGPYQQPSTRLSLRRSLTNLVPSWRDSSVSLNCPQIPPLDLGDVVWYSGPFLAVTPSLPTSDRASLRSSRAHSVISRTRTATPSIQRRPSTAPSASTRSRSLHSSGTGSSSPSTQHTIPTAPGAHSSVHGSQRNTTPPLERQRTTQSSGSNIHPRASSSVHGSQRNTAPPLERQRTTQSSGLNVRLSTALTTRATGYVWKSGGQPRIISKATMEGLIHYLLLRSAEEDPEQHNTFFVGQLAVIDPFHVLEMLLRRFDEASMCPPEVSDDIQYRVMRLINDWLENEHVVLGDDLLTEMRNFVSDITAVDYPTDGIILRIVRSIRKKASMILPPPPLNSSYNPSAHTSPSPTELAYALTKLEGERYCSILPSEYVGHVCEVPQSSPNLLAAIDFNRRINYWVQSSILDMEYGHGLRGLEKRSETKRFFIKTAKECRTIGNFSSLGAIVDALQSTTVACLTLTHDRMPPAEQRQLEDLAKFLKAEGNYNAYRKALQKISRSKLNRCIPWHVVHLHDVNTIVQVQKDVDDGQDIPMLNFEKWNALKNEAFSILRFRDSHVADDNTFEDQWGLETAAEYLRAGLRGVSTGEEYGQLLSTNSSRIRANEDFLRAGR